jgi:4-hydroxy-tetrahydrodipicolinate synthase
MSVPWRGVFPAATTQFRPDQALDVPATLAHLDRLIEAGVYGLILLGTVGENGPLVHLEKLAFCGRSS